MTETTTIPSNVLEETDRLLAHYTMLDTFVGIVYPQNVPVVSTASFGVVGYSVAPETSNESSRVCQKSKGYVLFRTLKNCAVNSLVGFAKAVADNESSRPLCERRISQVVRAFRKVYKTADIEPVTFGWSKRSRRIRHSAKRFSEQSNADR